MASVLSFVAQSSSLRGHRVIARRLRRLAVDYAREHHLTAQLSSSLLVAHAFELEEDLEDAVELGQETIAAAIAAGHGPTKEQAVANQALALATLRRWDDLEAPVAGHSVGQDRLAVSHVTGQPAAAAY